MREAFEKFAAFIFLGLLVGLVAFLTFVPLPAESEKVILMIIGGLMASSATALPRLFGVEDKEKEALKNRVRSLEQHIAIVEARFETLQKQHDYMIGLLVERHVVKGDGNAPSEESEGQTQ